MKIAVVGCGAVGSYYGARLASAGHEVHFLLRSDYEQVRREGVVIQSAGGDLHVRPHCAHRPEDIGPSDLVLIALKTTANQEFPRLLLPLANPDTAVLTLQNGLGNEEQLSQWFSPKQILGGLCFVCLNRVSPGVVRHFDYGLVVMGEFSGPSIPRTKSLVQEFTRAGVPCRITDNLQQTHWEKLVWNIPFNGLGVAAAVGCDAAHSGVWKAGAPLGPCLPTDALLGHPRWATLVRELMLEIIHIAQARGMGLSDELADQQIARTQTMGSYRASTLLDFERRQPLELESIFLEPLRQGRQAGVSTPRLETLCAVLQSVSARTGLTVGGVS